MLRHGSFLSILPVFGLWMLPPGAGDVYKLWRLLAEGEDIGEMEALGTLLGRLMPVASVSQ